MKTAAVFFFLFIVLIGALNPAERDFRFKQISFRQGLSQSIVNCMSQDSQGYMWFGTEEGLNKYDGYTFKIYAHDPTDPQSLSQNVVMAIWAEGSGILWLGTVQGGLNRFDPKTEI
jgi:ligand-binding sensor domain-containing protein